MNVYSHFIHYANAGSESEAQGNVNLKDKIIQAVFACTAVHGLLDLRVKHIAAECGTSEGNIYRYFNSKDALLVECFRAVDREIAALYTGVCPGLLLRNANPVKAMRYLWLKYFDYLLAHPEKTVFYFHFRNSHYYTKELKKATVGYYGDFTQLIAEFDAAYRIFDHIDPALFWTYLMDSTVYIVFHILQGDLPNSEQTRGQAFSLLYGGIRGTFSAEDGLNKESRGLRDDGQRNTAAWENRDAEHHKGSGIRIGEGEDQPCPAASQA